MNLEKMFEMQEGLDNHIITEHELVGVDLLNHKIVALQVELAELANETRCFKYWSKKPPSDKEVILEEYADGIHFLLSIGLTLEYKDQVLNTRIAPFKSTSLVEQFNMIANCISTIYMGFHENYFYAFQAFLGLGEMLGFTADEIESAYINKNCINHDRQKNGY